MTVVRQLMPEDAAAFRDVHLEALKSQPEAFAAAYEEDLAQGVEAYAGRLSELTVLGAFLEGDLAGIVTLQPHPQTKRRHVAMLWGMYVKPAARGTGLAEALFEAALERARTMVDQLELYVQVGNDRARRFYVRYGFETYGIMRRSLRVDGVDYDAEMMVLAFR
jgi:ribosomal protein S18 acetylase RimI-like enzyme